MKHSYRLLALLPMFLIMLSACGSDDEPQDSQEQTVVTSRSLTSVHELSTDTYFTFDIDMTEQTAHIYCYNVQFTIGERKSPSLNILIDAPVTQSGNKYTIVGDSIVPYLVMNTTLVPVEEFIVTNLSSHVDASALKYDLFFNCHGGEYSNSGALMAPSVDEQ